MGLFIGVDGGATKTLAVLTDETGQVLGIGMGGTSNFQVSSVAKARAEVKKSIDQALGKAQATLEDLGAAYFGMAGADRPTDHEIVRELLAPIVPKTVKWDFENDAILGLWAATLDGVGVGVVCGTGTNVVGVNGNGKRVQVGGLGRLFGDYAGGAHIGELAVARAMRGHEGRGDYTLLYDRLCQHYGVTELLALVDYIYAGKPLNLSALAPLVIDTALEGDSVAQGILTEVGREMGISTKAAIERLFSKEDIVKVVAIGSVFQKSKSPLMYEEFAGTLQKTGFNVKPSILECEPVIGAVFGAVAQLKLEVTAQFKQGLQDTLPKHLSAETS